MARPLPAQGDDSTLNMTPMIDVCFQLIVFFMLTLRFKSVDKRFETLLPHDRGPRDTPAKVSPFQNVTVRLFREGLEGPAAGQRTKIRVGETFARVLPRGPWPEDGEGAAARRAEESRVEAEIAGAIATAWAAQGRSPEVKGAILAPRPTGDAVPHGDVMLVLDAFVDAGLTQVSFEGGASPLGRGQSGGWGFGG